MEYLLDRTQQRSFIHRQAAEDSFWLTLRLRILTTQTEECLNRFVKNYEIVYENRAYYKRHMAWRKLKGFINGEMTYSKSLLDHGAQRQLSKKATIGLKRKLTIENQKKKERSEKRKQQR